MNYRKTLVVSSLCYKTLPESAIWFLESASYHGIEVLTIDGIWQDFYRTKIIGVYEKIRNFQEYDYVIVLDGVDCLFATGLGEIHTKFDSIEKAFVIAGEHYCWPWWKRYDHLNPLPQHRFRHINSGFFMAEWPAYLDVIQKIINQVDDGYSERGKTIKNDDQAAFYRYWMEHPEEIKVDYQALLCLCTNGLDGRWIHNHDIEFGKRPFCHVTKTAPCVFHCNGGSKWRLKDLWDMLKR